jgi:hypothetical protein
MKIRIKHDNAYAIVCMIEINVITFLNQSNHRIERLNQSNHRIESAICKRKNEQEKK